MDAVKKSIREFLLTTCLPGESLDTLRDDTPLQTSGILDSLASIKLVMFLEQQFGVEMDVYDTSPERFDRLQDIAAAVITKQRQQTQAARATRA